MNPFTAATFAATGPALTRSAFTGSKPPPPFVERPPRPPEQKAKARGKVIEDKRLGPKADVDMDKLKELRRKGGSLRDIAKAMGHSKSTIANRLMACYFTEAGERDRLAMLADSVIVETQQTQRVCTQKSLPKYSTVRSVPKGPGKPSSHSSNS